MVVWGERWKRRAVDGGHEVKVRRGVCEARWGIREEGGETRGW